MSKLVHKNTIRLGADMIGDESYRQVDISKTPEGGLFIFLGVDKTANIPPGEVDDLVLWLLRWRAQL